ncbi:MAG: hypothetical protein Kow0063_39180 [Anaerolineae bacterium]
MKLSNVRALVVEDDHSWQQILAETLTDAGLTVDIAGDLETALAKLQAAPHRLAVVDLSLGGEHRNQDGLLVLDAVRRYDPACIPLLLSGLATVEVAVSALTEHGAYTCLQKETFQRGEFLESVSRALAEARPLVAVQDERGEFETGPSPEHAAITSATTGELALVVEDDAGWRSILAELLVEAGYQPRLCSGFGEAQGYLRRERYGIAVVDLSLTGSVTSHAKTGGYRLLTSTQTLGIPTIVVSGLVTPDDVEHVYGQGGVFACLEKQTFDRRAFLRIVHEVREAAKAEEILAGLTGREREVLGLVAQGLSNKEIARALVITTNTVKRHLKSIFEKLGVHSRAAAAAKAISAGIPAGESGAGTAANRADQDI